MRIFFQNGFLPRKNCPYLQIAQWDLALERDTETDTSTDPNMRDLPPQLLFIHQGIV